MGSRSNVTRAVFAFSLGSLGIVTVASDAFAGSTNSLARAHGVAASLVVAPVLLGSTLTHTFTATNATTPTTATLSNIDDLTRLGDELFVAFQNGVGPKGEPNSAGNLDSTLVEFTPRGAVLGQWDIAGRIDGIVADPQIDGVVATVNEDGNSSLYVFQPSLSGPQQVAQYAFDAGLVHGGGTDSLALVNGQLLVSASNPGTAVLSAPNATFPAVYVVALDATTMVAHATPLFYDEDVAKIANVGPTYATTTHLVLTDPDSSTVVSWSAKRFAGAFEMTSQGDQQQIFVRFAGTTDQKLSVLSLTQSIDDTAYVTDHDGMLFSTDATNNSVDTVTGEFSSRYSYAVATPCNAASAPSVCTASNYLATIDPWTGVVTPVAVTGAPYTPKGALLFLRDDHGDGHQRH